MLFRNCTPGPLVKKALPNDQNYCLLVIQFTVMFSIEFIEPPTAFEPGSSGVGSSVPPSLPC